MLRLKESIDEIATWSISKKKSIIISKINDQEIYEELDYTKSLIFISGNIDEAYEFSKQTSEVDVDADIFHDLSLNINILDIKKALNSRFKPEQIARFGNIQIIYPTLSKKSYESIIERKIDNITKNVKEKFGIKIIVDKSINSIIYDNGVFPTQGTRPVFSTITEILESPLPPFILGALSNKKKSLEIFYKNHHICAKIGDKILKFPYDGDLEKLKEDRNRNANKRTLNAVHEAGHAVAYALLFKLAPPQISALTASSDIGGFVWIHNICGSKALLEDKICAVLAGGAAERIVFGKNNSTWGLQDDLREATKIVGSMAKHYGMLDFNSFIMHPQRSDVVNTDVNGANPLIEEKMTEQLSKVELLLRNNIALFQETVDFLLEHKSMSPVDFKKICNNHGIIIKVQKSEEIVYSDYNKQYKSFKFNKLQNK
jgi:cell division protease FtsH